MRKVGRGKRKSRVGQTKKSSGRSVAGGWTGEIGLVENRPLACGDSNQACGKLLPGLWRFSSGLWLGTGRLGAQLDSCRLPSIPVDSALGRLGATRACERGRVREGPCTNAKSKCSETRPMGAGCRQIESVALCVWQCHLRNISTLSNRTHYRCQRRCKRKT